MGHQSRIRQDRKAETIHRKKLFDGKLTAEEVHRGHFPQDAYCKCGSTKVAICVRTFWPVEDLIRNRPEAAMALAAQHGGKLPCVDFTMGKHVRVGMAYACDSCKATLERKAASAPSWVVVEIDRGPGPDKPVVQVAGQP